MCGMQIVERPWGGAAYGSASVKAVPDLARVRFKVIRPGKAPAESFARSSDSVRAVREVLRAHGVPDSGVERSRLGLKSAWSLRATGASSWAYECTATFAVQSGDLDDVQRLLVDLVAAGTNEIEGVDFDVAGKPAMRAEARRKAVSAARDKAALYAEAAGVRLGPVVHIDDVDPESTRAERYRGHGYAGDEASAEDLAPGARGGHGRGHRRVLHRPRMTGHRQ
jgi:uncharacterized protein YggE